MNQLVKDMVDHRVRFPSPLDILLLPPFANCYNLLSALGLRCVFCEQGSFIDQRVIITPDDAFESNGFKSIGVSGVVEPLRFAFIHGIAVFGERYAFDDVNYIFDELR